MRTSITHLIFGPGGMKGVYYLGVLRYFYIEGIDNDIKYIAGTSIGAFFAIALALKIPIEYLESRLLQILSDIEMFNIELSFDTISQFLERKGVFNLDSFINVITDFTKENGYGDDISFIDFVKKTGVSIYISCTNINEKKCTVFSIDNTPNVNVFQALRASMSIPFMFEPVSIGDKMYLDGVLSSQLNSDNTFCDVPDYNKMYINITESKYDNPTPLPKSTYLSMYSYSLRTIGIAYKHAIKSNCDNTRNIVLQTTDLPFKALEYVIDNKTIKFILHENDYNSLVLHGFIDITNYINNRFDKKLNTQIV